MKKIVAMLLAAVMALSCVAAVAEGAPELASTP